VTAVFKIRKKKIDEFYEILKIHKILKIRTNSFYKVFEFAQY